jgi:type IV secretory pathway TraG/TraD family ATPase VirD4
MVAASPAAKGSRNESHWTSRAAALLGPLLYAAGSSGGDMVDVVTWVLSGDIRPADDTLRWAADHGDPDAVLARKVLAGVQLAADEERQSIWSATADVIDVYTTTQALEAATGSNFDPDQFVASADTVYIAGSAEHQAASAPLVVALIEAVRDAQYRRHRAEALTGDSHGAPVALILDEVANVAPIASLPGLVSEAGGQGLHVLAAVQDLSQVRGRWGSEVAEGFLSLFQHIVVLGGIRDTRTLEALSIICGEYDRPQISLSRSFSRTKTPGRWRRDRTQSWSSSSSTTRERCLPPGEVYALPDGQALYLYGHGWRFVTLAPHYAHPRWQAVLTAAPAHIQVWQPQPVSPGRAAHPAFLVPDDGDIPADDEDHWNPPGQGGAEALSDLAEARARRSGQPRRRR